MEEKIILESNEIDPKPKPKEETITKRDAAHEVIMRDKRMLVDAIIMIAIGFVGSVGIVWASIGIMGYGMWRYLETKKQMAYLKKKYRL